MSALLDLTAAQAAKGVRTGTVCSRKLTMRQLACPGTPS